MNLNKVIEAFEKEQHSRGFNRAEYTLTSILKLPLNDPNTVIKDISYSFRDIVDRNILYLMILLPKYQKNDFKTKSDFDKGNSDRYTDVSPVPALNYLKSVYKQWIDIAVKHNVQLPENVDRHKDVIINDLKNLLTPFEDFDKFIARYVLIEDYYVANRNDLESCEFYKDELDALVKKYEHIFSNEGARKFAEFKSDKLMEGAFDKMQTLLETVRAHIMKQAPDAISTIADKFIRSQDDTNDVTNFLKAKNFHEHIKMEIKLSQSQAISEMIHFKDGSSVVKRRSDVYKILPYEDLGTRTTELVESAIDYKLRKKPKVASFFKERLKEEALDFNDIDVVINTYLDNEQILKNMKFDLTPYFEKSVEQLDDIMHSKIREYKIERYANTILSNKYKHFLTKEALSTFKELYELEITEKALQDLIGKKLAAIKTPEDFEKYIGKIFKQFNGFNSDHLMTRLNNREIEPLLTDDDIFVFEVTDFESSKDLGSASWCISRQESYFNTYTSGGSRQFFVYDFNKSEKSNESMLGLTIYPNGTLRTQHLKNDDYAHDNDLLKDIKKQLILKELDKYELTDEVKLEYGLIDKKENIEDISTKKTLKAGL